MSGTFVVLAQIGVLEELAPTDALGRVGGMLVRDILLITGAVLVLAIVLVIWAKRSVRRSRHRRHRGARSSDDAPASVTTTSSREHRHHRHRRQRRDHRGRNPTLDETGGLPPMRSESSSTPRL